MRNKGLILSIFILMLVIGLLYNLFTINQKVNNSSYMNNEIANLKVMNADINFIVNSVGSKNYDNINILLLDIGSIIDALRAEIDKYKIDEKILLPLINLENNFKRKIILIEKFKSSNATFNNSYKNSLKLVKIIQNQNMDEQDKELFRNIMFSILLENYTQVANHIIELENLIDKKYKNDKIKKLFLLNTTICKKSFLRLKDTKINILDIKFKNNIDEINVALVKYNKTIIDNIRNTILIFIASLLIFFIVLYVLIYKIELINSLLNKKTEDLKKSLLTISENVIYSSTNLRGVITDVSEAFCKISGYEKDELIGKQHSVVRHPDEGKEVFKELWETIKKDKTWRGKVKNLKKDGGYYWVYAVITPIYDTKNRKIGYSSIRQDITDKNKIEELNRTLEHRVNNEVDKNRQKDQQLLEQSRLAQMGEMISMIAHQWRQPLTAISATSAGLELKATIGRLDNDIVISQAQKIGEFSQHLSATIDDFRDFFKKDKDKKEVTYTEMVDSVLTIVQASIENSNIEIIKELNYKESFQIYPNELKQVLLNLIKNAEDILVEKDIKNPYIKITTYSEENKHILEVSDNGGGIPEEIINKIFDPYFSTKHEKNGTGLGLYMSKTIIEDHCYGKLSVSNSTDGAVFKIVL